MISLGLIGCGEVAESGHLPAILNDDSFRLDAVCDINAARAELLARRAGGVAVYSNWRDLLAHEPKLDGVVLALPPEVSPAIAVEALRRKLAVLDEKPLAATLANGRRLQDAVTEYNGVFQVGFVLRYGDWVEQIRRMVPSLGTPLQINVEVYDERLNPADLAHLTRIQSFMRHSSVMTHEGSHVIDYVRIWHPAPWTCVSAVTQQTSPTFSGPNVWSSQIQFEDGSTLNAKIAWLLTELPPSTVTLVGSEGRLDLNCVTGQGIVEIKGVEQPFETRPLAPDWARQYRVFAEAIDRGRAQCASINDGMHTLEVTAACELSARTGSVVRPADLIDRRAADAERPHPTADVR